MENKKVLIIIIAVVAVIILGVVVFKGNKNEEIPVTNTLSAEEMDISDDTIEPVLMTEEEKQEKEVDSIIGILKNAKISAKRVGTVNNTFLDATGYRCTIESENAEIYLLTKAEIEELVITPVPEGVVTVKINGVEQEALVYNKDILILNLNSQDTFKKVKEALNLLGAEDFAGDGLDGDLPDIGI